MLISHEYKFIFIHVGKTGGTSISRALCNYLDMDVYKTKFSPTGESWKHLWAVDVMKYIGEEIWNEYFTFSFVRNPFDMLLSLYSMYTQYPEYTDPINHLDLYHPWNQYQDFADFILSMGARRHEPDDQWRLQLDELDNTHTMDVWDDCENLLSTYLTDSWKGQENGEGEILVDFIGRYENLTEDFHDVCQRLNLPRLELSHTGATRHKPYQDVYTEEMRAIVSQHFALDLERFGYVFA